VNTSAYKITTPLLGRVVIFLGLFVLFSGAIGSRIISGNILFRDGFAIYGGLGKAAIFGLIAFVLLVRHKGFKIKLKPWQPMLLGWLILSIGLYLIAWGAVGKLLLDQRTAQNIILAHGGLVLSVAAAAVACFGPNNMRLLWRTYRRELVMSSLTAGLFYLFLLCVYMLWQPLASIVLICVKDLLALSGISTELIPPRTLVTNKFGITVAQYCSGIESIALFSGLYGVVGLLERNRLNLRRYILVFPVAIFVLFGLNIVRVFSLIVMGYYVNPKIAFSLFHTYAGMIFFIIYSAVFWAIAYKHLLNKPKLRRADLL
jgi:exosortase/archaeosortase family protein